jgi:GntR family transcriptional regulator
MSLSGHHDNVQPQRLVAMGAPSLRRDSAMPFYEQLKQVLLSQIEQGDVQPGDPLPSEFELCAQFGVSRTVVRQAIGELVNEGRLYRMRGKGTFVAKPKLHEQFMESTVGFFEDMTSHGHSVSSSVLSIDRIEVAGRIRELMGADAGAHCIEVVRQRAVNDEVVAFTKSYVNRDDPQLLEHLRAADLSQGSLYRILEESFGLRIESGHRSIEATAAAGMMTKLLDVGQGDPLLYVESVGRDAYGGAIECFRAWHRADRMRVEMDVVRDKRPSGALVSQFAI